VQIGRRAVVPADILLFELMHHRNEALFYIIRKLYRYKQSHRIPPHFLLYKTTHCAGDGPQLY
jgi:hypothetical protein